MNERLASFWDSERNGSARCRLCPHGCLIPPNESGLCGVRINRSGTLYAAAYGLISSIALDAVEKKPLSRFYPGRRVLSIGMYGCNMRCPFCQNHTLSRDYNLEPNRYIPVEKIVSMAVNTVAEGNIGAAYTYNEPVIGFEYILECMKQIRNKGLKNVMVTNGYISEEPLLALLPYTDAMNIDLKAYTDAFYHICGGSLEPVLRTIRTSAAVCHVEITTLVLPGENERDIRSLASWIASVNPDVPLHLSRFFPRYQYADRKETPREAVLRAAEEAKRHLTYVYTGNM